jgi:microcystin-dependent protein
MSDQAVGEIRIFAGNYAPQGWALCDGSLLPIANYQVLFSLIGTTYGGNGTVNFALPNLRSRVPIGVSGTNHALGNAGGAEYVTLTEAQMPEHGHDPMATSANATTSNPAGNLLAKTVNSAGGTIQDAMYLKVGAPTIKTGELNTATVAPACGHQSHDNLMPSFVINFIIALEGYYPDFN